MTDIRDHAYISPEDVTRLNFIRKETPFRFRRHYRQGLRSHIMEVLDPARLADETTGVMTDGIRTFPKAVPLRMLRIFRSRFASKSDAMEEIVKYRYLLRFLPPGSFAVSDEFLVSYRTPRGWDVLLCGWQEYMIGKTLDPWRIVDSEDLRAFFEEMRADSRFRIQQPVDALTKRFLDYAADLIDGVKAMVLQAGHIPDLAGVGNLLVSPDGRPKLVDINNITPVSFSPEIRVDDKGYPVCDKSIEALSILESHLPNRNIADHDPVYRHFLTPARRKAVRLLEERFYNALATA